MLDTDSFTDIEILAKTIWGEARGEIYMGQQAIACVVLNRVKHNGWWGSDVRSVCLKPYQFSCWLFSDPNRQKLMEVTNEDSIYAQNLNIASMAISGVLNDVTDGSDSYYRMGTPVPNWARNLTPITQIGNHLFFATV